MIKFFLNTPFKGMARIYGRNKIEETFNALLLADPDYKDYVRAYILWRDELAYSRHCGSIRDGSDSDRDYNIRIDKKVAEYKEAVDVYHRTFMKKYWNNYSIPMLLNSSVLLRYNEYSKKDERAKYYFGKTLTY